MDPSVPFKEFFKKFKVQKGSPFSHITRDPNATYFIDSDDLRDFYRLYSDTVKKGNTLTVAERPSTVTPYHADFDFKMTLGYKLPAGYSRSRPDKSPVGEPRIYKRYLKRLVSVIQDIIKEIVADADKKILYALVLEKKGSRESNGRLSDGFHLHFPFFFCEPWVFDAIRAKCIKYITEENLWSDIKFAPNFTTDNIVDSGMGKKVWHMYGSSKDGGEAYLVTRCYSEETELISLKEVFEDEMLNRKKSVEYYLPEFLSIRLHPDVKETLLKPSIVAIWKEKYCPKKKAPSVKPQNEVQTLEEIKLIKDAGFMDMLSDDRAANYETWMEIGWTLFNIGFGHDETLKMWDEFSRRCPEKYKEGECEEIWGKMEIKNMTMGSLKHFAKKDSPEKYEAWRTTNLRMLLEKCLYEKKPTEYDLTCVIILLYRDRFVCAEARKDTWYEYRGHRWFKMEEPLSLKKLLFEDVRNMFDSLRLDLAHKQTGTEGDARAKLEYMEAQCKKIISALKTESFVGKVVKTAKVYFYDMNFIKRRDSNKMLFACNNGVLDLTTCTFRDGRPDDYITLSCGYDYKEYTATDADVKEVEKMWKRIITIKATREYFLNCLGMALEGGNPLKKSLMCTGSGNNAKTKSFEFIAFVFGDYCFQFDTCLFIQGSRKKSNSAGPRPDLTRMIGRRIGMFKEVGKGDKLDVGVFKELTGGDLIAARGMYKEEVEDIRPQMVIMSQFNDPPVIKDDDAIWIRIRKILFESKFYLPEDRDKVPKTEKEQFETKSFLADPRISSKFPEMAPAFLWLLFNRYKNCKVNPIVEPKEVKESTEAYRNSNDVLAQFRKEIEDLLDPEREPEEDDPEDLSRVHISGKEAHAQFKDWHRTNYGEPAKMNYIVFNTELSKKLHRRIPEDLKNKHRSQERWYGYRFHHDDDDKQIDFVDEKKRVLK